MPSTACPLSCPICESTSRHFVCQNCLNNQDVLLTQQKQHLQLKQCLTHAEQLRQQKAEVLQCLEAQLAVREAAQAQQVVIWQKAQALKAAQAKAQKAKAALAQAQQQLHSLQAASANRRKVLDQLVQRTAATRVEVLGTELPNILRIQTLTLSHVKAMLEREQRLRLRQLTEIVPLRINAVSEKGGPIQITICNLRLPESGSTPTGGWPEPEATSAALGYLLLFIDQVGLIMGGPMLHESLYQGSTSSIWQPPGFWTRQPRSPAAVLPLNVLPTGMGAGAAAGQAAYTSSTNKYLQTAQFWGLPRADSGGLATGTAAAAAAAHAAASAATAAAAAFSRATGFEAPGFYSSTAGHTGLTAAGSTAGGVASSGGSSSSSNPPEPGGWGGKGADFKAAWDLMQRSLACFLKDKAAKHNVQLPPAWNPLAWLVVYCATVTRDGQQDRKLVALSSRATAAAAASAAAAAGAAGRPAGASGAAVEVMGLVSEGIAGSVVGGAAGGPRADSTGAEWEDLEEEEEDEGWVVQTPFLPPPPSQPDQVEHWVRAMYADPNALASSGQQASNIAGLALPGRRGSTGLAAGWLGGNIPLGSSPSNSGGMMPVERIRSLFSN